MSEPLEAWIDAAIGETREALVRDGEPIALRVARASDEGRRARWGELYVRARARDRSTPARRVPRSRPAARQQGFLPLERGRPRAPVRASERVALREGEGVVVSVTREAARGKSAGAGAAGDRPRRRGAASHRAPRVRRRYRRTPSPPIAQTRAKLDAVIEDALSRTAPIPGGGVLTIEPTAALVAIDVDAGGRGGSGDPERFALDLNIAAAQEAARQMRLRNLGGIIAIDFVSMRAKSHRAQLEAAVRDAFAGDPWSVQFGALVAFRRVRAGARAIAHAAARTDARCGRALERGERGADGAARDRARSARGDRPANRLHRRARGEGLARRAPRSIGAPSSSNRIGMRWTLDAAPGPREKIDARAL